MLYKYDQQRVPHLLAALDSIYISTPLSQTEFADLVVTMIQDIPYSYIKSGLCESMNKECHGEEIFGILAPAEFAYHLYGDCDTRTLFLFLILKHFGYDVAILVSENYAHSMLGIRLPIRGKHILHQGKKYLFWETTSRHWQAGELPPDYRNTNYWHVALNL